MAIEEERLFRNMVNYNNDVLKGNYSDNIQSFHVTYNFFVNMMHDLFEGICHFDICKIIEYYIEMKIWINFTWEFHQDDCCYFMKDAYIQQLNDLRRIFL